MQKQFLNIKFATKNTYEDGRFKGYASVFNNLDNNNDVILPDAFVDLEADNIRFLWQHDATQPIGKIKKLYQDKKGLVVEGKISLKTVKGREVYNLLKDEVVNGLSIGFEVKDFFYQGQHRYISKIKLWEVSIVTFPANSEAKIMEIKAITDAKLTKAISQANLAWYRFLECIK